MRGRNGRAETQSQELKNHHAGTINNYESSHLDFSAFVAACVCLGGVSIAEGLIALKLFVSLSNYNEATSAKYNANVTHTLNIEC